MAKARKSKTRRKKKAEPTRKRVTKPVADAKPQVAEPTGVTDVNVRNETETVTESVETPLNAKQERFVQEYLVDLNATRAAIRAGYSKKTARAIGCENLTKPNVAAAIEARQKQLAAKLEITQEDIAKELTKLAFANMGDYIRVLGNGEPAIDLSECTRDQLAALSEVSVEDFLEGRGEDAREVRRVKVKPANKQGSLMDLAKLLGYVKPEKHEHEHKGRVEVLDQKATKRLSDAELAQATAAAKVCHDLMLKAAGAASEGA